MSKKLSVLLAVVALFTLAPVAHADLILQGPVTPTDLDLVDLGVLIAGPLPGNFISSPADTNCPSCDVGDIVNNVYFNEETGVYTYTHTVTPGVGMNNVSTFNTGFGVLGFNDVAGYSFSGSVGTGGLGAGDWDINFTDLGRLQWTANCTEPGGGGGCSFPLDIGQTLTFFFQSTLPPTHVDTYNLIDSHVGTTSSYAPGRPVAEPATLMLLGMGLLGSGLIANRRRK